MSIIKLSVCLHKQTIPYDHKKGSFFLPLTIISVASVINYVFKILFLDFFFKPFDVCDNLASVLCFAYLATRNTGPEITKHRSNQHPLRWRVKS